jgi:restriction system protein
MTAVELPQYYDLLWPVLRAVAELGGSASIGEIAETVIASEGLTEAQQAVLHRQGPQTEIGYRLAWARTDLKGMGLLANSARGVWTLTDDGSVILTADGGADDQKRVRTRGQWLAYVGELRKARTAPVAPANRGPEPASRGPEPQAEEIDWKEQLLEQLVAMGPDAFERLAQRLLREADFDSVTVTGKSGDGGIDGFGVYRLGLVSFPVFFQCKRYQGSVSSAAVRDFRGAMAGRGDKGLLITTGTFTAHAKQEATRDGAPPVDLIDGDRLCDLLKEHDLGVQTEIVEKVTVNAAFFSQI